MLLLMNQSKAQFSFETYHCYKIQTDSTIEYCYDYIQNNFVDIEDLSFFLLWFPGNEISTLDFINFIAAWETGGCDLYQSEMSDYLYYEQTTTGATFYYQNGTAELQWTSGDEFDVENCNLICLYSFIYIWGGNKFYFHR